MDGLHLPIIGFLTIVVGYIIQTSAIQYIYYVRSHNNAQKWKIQSNKTVTTGPFYSWPIFSNKPNRGEYHRLFTFINLMIAGSFAFYVVHIRCRPNNNLLSLPYSSYPIVSEAVTIIIEILLSILFQSIVEYYWHRLMHMKYVYRLLHKYHHFYKSPEPWDDLYIHPIEAFGYYCILYGPALTFDLHYISIIIYMIIHGIFGVLDHSGVHFQIPGVYNTVDHDNHHLKCNVNYSFPFPYMDILHGTFYGHIFGISICPELYKK